MIVGIDPGSTLAGVAIFDGAEPTLLRLVVVHGESAQRATKDNPDPEPLNPYVAARELALEILRAIGVARTEDVAAFYIEGPAIGKFGRQDTLAAARQALFDALVQTCGTFAAAARFKPISPATAKKALTGYSNADKRRVREAAEVLIRASWPSVIETWHSFNQREQEAAADALAVLLGGTSRGKE